MDEGSESMEDETHLPLTEIAEDPKLSNSVKVWLMSLLKIFSLFHLCSSIVLHRSLVSPLKRAKKAETQAFRTIFLLLSFLY